MVRVMIIQLLALAAATVPTWGAHAASSPVSQHQHIIWRNRCGFRSWPSSSQWTMVVIGACEINMRFIMSGWFANGFMN
ncbi:hypothetical protein P152DRAFT_460785 [Eremomyces bilateralis CBS 781.70]|uniref:Secreted protein n=1 Tax=Eremomyces bilateralis CBS 781.70 TaxID=1392243 RepID=A0A6G1FWL3_9PEZI|nr:uncharacterized protein P152DRAFT_460785 [Eremomyces bilateralis CBS 781.70]KAF1810275.1 hypothetical protein P152DRAFT_460785 [Eremomyces bilateralis CBS 781.70]